MVRIHGVKRSKWADLWMKSNLRRIMDRQVLVMAQLFGGSMLREDAELPNHTYALVFDGASAALRFSMALQVATMYATWDKEVLEASLRPHLSRSGQLLVRGPTASLMVVTLSEMDANDLADMFCSMSAYDSHGRWNKGRRSGDFMRLNGGSFASGDKGGNQTPGRNRDPAAPPFFAPPHRSRATGGGNIHADEALSSSGQSVASNEDSTNGRSTAGYADDFDDDSFSGKVRRARRSFINAIKSVSRLAGSGSSSERAESRHDVLKRVWAMGETNRQIAFSEVWLPA